MSYLFNFQAPLNVGIVGVTGGIGRALLSHLTDDSNIARIYAYSRSEIVFEDALDDSKVRFEQLDLTHESTIARAAALVSLEDQLDIMIIATGLLHSGATLKPEKNLSALNVEAFARAFAVNTIGPALIAKHFLPCMRRDRKIVFAALSARVGSIADNRLGGWYSYRASKAALNMLIRTIAIETRRINKESIVVGLHPGTVDTSMSRPFQSNVPPGRLFSPDTASRYLLAVINERKTEDSGKIFAWDGQEIPF